MQKKNEQKQSGNSTNSQRSVFAAPLRQVPMGCRDAVLPEPLTKNHTVNCLTYEENTRRPYNHNLCLFRVLVLHLHGNGGLEGKTSKMLRLLLEKIGTTNPASFQGVRMNYIPNVEDLVQSNIFLYDKDFVDGAMTGELARKSVGKHSNAVRLLPNNSYIYYVFDINVLFEVYRCKLCDIFFKKF